MGGGLWSIIGDWNKECWRVLKKSKKKELFLPKWSQKNQMVKNSSKMVQYAPICVYWDNVWKSLECKVVKRIPREVPRPKPKEPQASRIFGRGTSQGTPFTMTRRYGPLHGPTSSSCGGFHPSAEASFCPLGKKRPYYAVLAHFWPF